jgi:hypothetical protein
MSSANAVGITHGDDTVPAEAAKGSMRTQPKVSSCSRSDLFLAEYNTRIQGALKNLGHRVARSRIATILKEHGIPPSAERPMSWQVFLRAHWRALMAADFFTSEVWTGRGLVKYYTLFVIELHSRRGENCWLHAASERCLHASNRAPAHGSR